MKKRKYFAVAASAAVALSAVFSPLTMYAQNEEMPLEKTSSDEPVNHPDEFIDDSSDALKKSAVADLTYTTDNGRVQIHNYEGELPESLFLGIGVYENDRIDLNLKSIHYFVELTDSDGGLFVPENENAEYTIYLHVPTEFIEDELQLYRRNGNIDEVTEVNSLVPGYEEINFEREKYSDEYFEVIVHTDNPNQDFILVNLSKEIGNPNIVIDESGITYKSEQGNVRISGFLRQPSEDLEVVYKEGDASQYTTEMGEKKITDFKVWDVQLLDSNQQNYEVVGARTKYEFQMLIPEEYKTRDLGIYRIYGPGTYEFTGDSGYSIIASGHPFAMELKSSVNRVHNTIHWESDDLGTYVLANKGETADLNPTVLEDETGITYKTDAGEIRIENFNSKPPEGVHATLARIDSDDDSVSYSIKLLDENNQPFTPDGAETAYKVRLKIPEEFIGHKLEMTTEESTVSRTPTSISIIVNSDPVAFELSEDGKELIMSPSTLDKKFVLKDTEAEKKEEKDNPRYPAGVISPGDQNPDGSSGGNTIDTTVKGSNSSEKKSSTSKSITKDDEPVSSKSTTTTTTRQNSTTTVSPNTGLQQRFGLWFTGLFAGTAGIVTLLKKKYQDD